tara:strand:+ start:3605 stop:3871 length:267 start_codon:yes stop_codon:yes gene_type:complete
MFAQFDEIKVLENKNFQKVPIVCPVCNWMMKETDILEYRKYECCEHCSLIWAQPNSKKWKKGWRPGKREINRMVKNKKLMPSYIMRGL